MQIYIEFCKYTNYSVTTFIEINENELREKTKAYLTADLASLKVIIFTLTN